MILKVFTFADESGGVEDDDDTTHAMPDGSTQWGEVSSPEQSDHKEDVEHRADEVLANDGDR